MAVKTKIPLEKIMALKKRLHNLPSKDTGKTRDEAMEILAPVFQSALRKGYSLKELRGMTTEEGVTLALAGLAEKKSGERKTPVQQTEESAAFSVAGDGGPTIREQETEIQQADDGDTASVPQTEDALSEKQQSPAGKIAVEAMKKFVKADEKPAHGFKVRPDTPDTEL